ncbi:MAG: hypothetical protein WCV92_01760 [Candidatus Buchananbacteria bacterium]|jgi:hypothetical protein
MTITICSSVNFSPKIIEIKKELEDLGHQVNIPYITQKIMDGEISFEEYIKTKEENGGDILLRKPHAVDMIKRYFDLIKNSDAVLVLNMEREGVGNYIGGSVLMEMGFAYGFEKKIYLYNPITLKSDRMHYLDEILDTNPIVIEGDLSKIK